MVIMNATWITVLIISFTLFFTILYWFYILPPDKAKRIALITTFLASIAITIVLFNVIGILGKFGGLLILLFWLIPSLAALKFRKFFANIEQRKLVGMQIFRLIGGCFLLEMARGYIPASFALPAGLGDLFVGAAATLVFFLYEQTPRRGVILVTFLGLLDFASAFFFGFTSSPGPWQLFAFNEMNQINLFPTGMIPIYLVPYALVNHTLSIINLKHLRY